MALELGIKSDPIEYRYSFDWLFKLMQEQSVQFLQVGTFFELYSLDDEWFLELRALAKTYGIKIKSVFTAHRELGGFFSGDGRMEKAARKNYERLIEVAAVLGADTVGSNPGAVFRDRMTYKPAGIECYKRNMQELSHYAYSLGLKALTIEPMSCLAEVPTLPGEVASLMGELAAYYDSNKSTSVPFYLCGDVSHGYADSEKKVIHGNMELFDRFLPLMCEFHFKNTDAIFGSTFGFGPQDLQKGIVDVAEIVRLVRRRHSELPVDEFVGYLEIGGPKLGRDYSDMLLGAQLAQSLGHIKSIMASTDTPSAEKVRTG